MTPRRELAAFVAALGALLAVFFGESLFGGKVLSPADVLFASACFRDGAKGADYEPANRLLMDPVLQFQPWLEFNRAMLRRGRLPVWNGFAGCGAPHLANGQSAVFDPFHGIAYLGTLPEAYAWMAAARLMTAGLGMFLLARAWGLGGWGRWFAGLVYPFCGFLVAWLLYPVTSVAAWMPWLLLASDRAIDRPGPRSVGALGLVAGLVLLGGHVQTSAHVLLASGLYATWRAAREPKNRRGLAAWGVGIVLGVGVASAEVIPLGDYLTRSPVWGDRAREKRPIAEINRPRWLDALRTAFPYALGSQRRGQPNLARALGAHNLNESAGGFVGLATLVWLAPLGWSARRRVPRAAFLGALVVLGAMGAFGVPPVENVLRALPVLDVTDNRRLTLWVAFGLAMLGGIGLDHLAGTRGPRARPWIALGVASGLAMLVASSAVGRLEPRLRDRAEAHYARTTAEAPAVARARADRQVKQALAFVPRYLALSAGEVLLLASMAWALRRGTIAVGTARPALLGLTLLDLFAFGHGLNPAIATADHRAEGPVIAELRRSVGDSGRVLGVGEELPPNVLMRFGLADVRNYDSVELSRSLDWLGPLYEPGIGARTSRRTVTWAGVLRARDRLREASVRAVVGATPPPAGAFDRVDRVGSAWIARLDAAPRASAPRWTIDHDRIDIDIDPDKNDSLIIVRETYDPGWRAEADGVALAVGAHRGAFLAVRVPPGARRLSLRYEPVAVRAGLAGSLFCLSATVFALTGFRPLGSTRFLVQGLGRTQADGLESVV